ncbi:hypothetical protein DFP89_1411 [Paracoccus lutimaris]|uniref:Phage integrase family protein n=2 Tax=Paracoccus lutimaris TaxID=1490030 RepID=A0A368YDJ1_9RHOB|nr:hypothetical protein DFP89_1411 [Paracoccus lutimaris]
MTQYGKADGLRAKAVLMKLPPNVAKSKVLRGLSYADAAAKAEALGMAPMSITNYNKALQRIGSFFHWAERNTVGTVTNPVNGLRLKDPIHAKDKRDPLTPEELGKLFGSPVWRSCRSARFRHEPGNVVMNGDWRFWLPLLGLWSGARSNELGQLLLSDIKDENGVAYLHVIDDIEGKRVKTAYARRKVPIHDQLKSLGLLSFVADRRRVSSPEDRLFPDLRVGAKGYYSHNVTRFFSGYLEKTGIKTAKNSFHIRDSVQQSVLLDQQLIIEAHLMHGGCRLCCQSGGFLVVGGRPVVLAIPIPVPGHGAKPVSLQDDPPLSHIVHGALAGAGQLGNLLL